MPISGIKKSKQLAICLLCLVAWACALDGAPANRSKQYYNKNFDFCLQFPSTWTYQESFTRNGAIFAPSDARTFSRQPQITVGAHINQRFEENGPSQTLEDIFNSGVHSLREYDRADEITVVAKKNLTIDGFPALATTIQYKQSGKEWFDKDVNLIDKKQIVYFAELKCHPKDAAVLEAIFDAAVRSLRLQCSKTRTK